MKQEFSHARDYIDSLSKGGRHHVTTVQAQEALGTSSNAVKLALNRLRKRGKIASPARGFNVIIPPEYRAIGCLPADQVVQKLMANLNLPYFAGLLTAAQTTGPPISDRESFKSSLKGRGARQSAAEFASDSSPASKPNLSRRPLSTHRAALSRFQHRKPRPLISRAIPIMRADWNRA